MKELSIKEKAKAYDEAYKRAAIRFGSNVADELFPELKETEDERIRKAILNHLKKMWGNNFDDVCGVHTEDAIAWLERQGNTPKKVTCTQEVEVGNGNIKALVTKDYNIIDPHFAKPIDKVEPKFKVGDWITNGDYTWKIVEVKPLDYILQSQDGNIVDDTISHVDEYFHLWTIQDAKNGDVLVDVYGNIGIYQQHDDFDWRPYCSIGCNGGFKKFIVEHEIERTCPATKEQRELLFQKMKEDGYEWNAEKKELKTIEQEISEGIEIPFGASDSELQEATYYIPEGFHAEIKEDKVVIKKGEQKPTIQRFKIGDKVHCGDESQPITIIGVRNDAYITDSALGVILFSDEDKWELVEQLSSEWSEEDELMCNNLIQMLIRLSAKSHTNSTSLCYCYPKEIDWLKALKERIGG